MPKSVLVRASGVWSAVAFIGAALGQDGGVSGAPAPGSPSADGPMAVEPALPTEPERLARLTILPYAWLTGFDGDVGARGFRAGVNESFADILGSSESVVGLMGAIELQVGSVFIQVNGAYTAAEFGGSRTRVRDALLTETVVVVDADLEVQAAWFEAVGGYRIVRHAFEPGSRTGVWVDALAGFRHTRLELDQRLTAEADLTLPGGLVLSGGASREADADQSWFEPLVGARVGLDLADDWQVTARADVGGFGVDDCDLAWQVIAGVGRTWEWRGCTLGVFAGYRALGQDYEHERFVWDVVTHGPILGCGVSVDF